MDTVMSVNAEQLIALLDLTSLRDDETEADTHQLCDLALVAQPYPAAICVYPKWVEQVKSRVRGQGIKVATVINFPSGNFSESDVLAGLSQAIDAGVDEVDLVLPYQDYLSGHKAQALGLVATVRAMMLGLCLKVILETSAFPNSTTLSECCAELMPLGVDFLKTSTGFSEHGVTPQSAQVLLNAAAAFSEISSRTVGVKCSGGVRTIDQARDYYAMAQQAYGVDCIGADQLRLGASALLQVLREQQVSA